MDNGEDGSDEGDDGDKEGEREGGLLAISLTPAGEEEAAGLLLKPDAGVKSMGQEDWSCRGQTVEPGGWKQRGARPHRKNGIQQSTFSPVMCSLRPKPPS